MNAVLKPPVPRILPVTKASRVRMEKTVFGPPSNDIPLSVLLSKMPLLPFLSSAEEVGVLRVSSTMSVGAAIQALAAKGASLALVYDSDNKEQTGLPRAWAPEAPYLGLVQLSRLVLWMLQQAASADMDKSWTEQSPHFCAASPSEQPADAASVNRMDLPVLISEKWMGEGHNRGALPRHTEYSSEEDSSDGETDEPRTFVGSMSHFQFFRSLRMASLARTSCWQPFLPLSSSATMLDAIVLTAQHGPLVLPVLSSKPPDPSDAPSCPPIIQGYLTPHSLLAALAKLSGLQWFDSLLGKRTLGQLVGIGLGIDAQEVGVDASLTLLQAFVHLYETEQAALPVFERTAGGSSIVGELAQQGAHWLLMDEGLFRRIRQSTVGEYVRAKVSRAACNGGEAATSSSSRLSASEIEAVGSGGGESSEVSDEKEGMLVFQEGMTVNCALKALSKVRQASVYVLRSSPQISNGRRWSQADKSPPATTKSPGGAHQTKEGVNDGGAGSLDANGNAEHHAGASYTILSGKDLVSLLTPTSGVQTKAAWDSFYESVVYATDVKADQSRKLQEEPHWQGS